jgi:hypothetical protein
MKTIALTTSVLIIFLSSNRQHSENDKLSLQKLDKFFEIRCEDLIKSKETISLSQIASNVKYIQLETNDDCLIGKGKYFFTDSLIFVSNRDHILKFSRSGKFIKKIGNPGRGPGEIDVIRIMSIIPDKRLIVVQKNSQHKLLYFSFEGALVKTINIPDVYNIKVMNDGKYIAYEVGSNGSEKYTFRLTNEKDDTLSVVNNYTTWPYVPHIMVVYNSFEPFYFCRNSSFLKALYNDTVYTITSDKIRPCYFINLGKYKLPDELRPERIELENIKTDWWNNRNKFYFSNVFEAGGKIFLALYSYGSASPKYLLFDKVNKKGNLLINDVGASTGFINDWDGGLDLWPIGSISNDQVFMPIDVLTFQKALKFSRTDKRIIKFQENYKQLEKMISSLAVTDNPIIMVVTLKK